MKWQRGWQMAATLLLVVAGGGRVTAQNADTMDSLFSLIGSIYNALPRNRTGVSTTTTTTTTERYTTTTTKSPSPEDTKQGMQDGEPLTGFSFSEIMPNSLRALENFDDLLRTTIPQLDQFNCLERVMCEMASTPGDRDEIRDTLQSLHTGAQSLHGGVQTLQQLQGARPVPPRLHHQQGGNLRPHQQNFQQHQQHQQQLIQQHYAQQHQQQQHPGQLRPNYPHHQPGVPQQQFVPTQHQQQYVPQHVPQRPTEVPPLPYYIPSAPDSNFGRGTANKDDSYLTNEIGHRTGNYNDNHARNPNQGRNQNQASHVQGRNHNQASHVHIRQTRPQRNANYHNQMNHGHGVNKRQFNNPRVNRHAVNRPNHPRSLQKNRSNGGRRRRVHNQQRRYQRAKRDVNDSDNNLSHRETKIAPVFQTPKKNLEVRGRSIKSESIKINSPALSDIAMKIQAINAGVLAENKKRSIDTTSSSFNNATQGTKQDVTNKKTMPKRVPVVNTQLGPIRTSEGPSPVRTLSFTEMAEIRERIRAYLTRLRSNEESGRSNTRQGRFMRSFLSGWTIESLLRVMDNYMEGYSFHPYTHAAYMGYTSRDGGCQNMYPKCPDSANDMLDFVNNFHSYFPNGVPFRDRMPWPINSLLD